MIAILNNKHLRINHRARYRKLNVLQSHEDIVSFEGRDLETMSKTPKSGPVIVLNMFFNFYQSYTHCKR